MLSSKTKRNISRIIPFGLIWLVSGLVFLIVEKGAIGDWGQHPSAAIEMNFKIFIFSSLAITIVGLLVGTIELVYLNNVFAKKSFTKKILYKMLLYTLMLFVITLITFPIAASLELNTGILDPQVWNKLYLYLTSFNHLSTDVQLTVALGVSLFYAEISENIGHGVLINFFTGKYHTPTEENRIFMFLDMKSSTTIAEQLGHIEYFELLREYYADLSDAIIQYSGEVYQYVGDEIVVSWAYKAGVANNNCLKCFFAMKEDLRKRADWYKKRFGLLPTFKAGFHFGKVTTGEIGVLKKEIIFTGDVLNATARIQGLCNQYKVDLLISDDLIKELDLNAEFQIKSLGENELRGKTENLELYTIV
ncbi:MAG: adenylate/guanylate cyclase domain-containing protein [Lewinellaceae bacterium]|nr:adenylate/guanylate cyclase domain-containing protein [Phaeodactylibacter sp.]MCB0613315.1 adenylate/guanylate cyclase domain-containing protein [Phaeodactylibacter sp.]MCB9346080.1 adenylate/guanylate cyclase domain-containing protein [Lewinellaceae bacterium]